MRYFAVNAAHRWILPALVAATLVTVAASLMLQQRVGAESVVQALVCKRSASVAIAQPHSDSVVTQSPLEISGSVEQANQIEVYVDGAFSGIVPLSASTKSFETNVALVSGTHTVKLVAVDACQIANGEAAVVVTYQLAAGQSTGSDTATSIGGGGVVIGRAVDPVTQEPSNLLDRLILRPLRNAADVLDLVPADTSRQGAISPAVRLLLLVGGAMMIIFSSALIDMKFVSRPLSALGSHLRLHTHHGSHLLVIVIGSAITLLPFLL